MVAEVRKEEGSLNNHSSVNESGSPGGLFAQASSRLSDGAVVASVTPPPVFKVPEIVDVKTGEENDKNILQVDYDADWLVCSAVYVCFDLRCTVFFTFLIRRHTDGVNGDVVFCGLMTCTIQTKMGLSSLV